MMFPDAVRSAGFIFTALMAVASVITVTNGAPSEIRRSNVATRIVNGAEARSDRAAPNKQIGNCAVEKNYVLYNNRCIKLYTIPKNYMTAGKVCEADGAHLFNMKDPNNDVQALQSLLNTAGQQLVPNTVSSGLWVGANDLVTEGSYQWTDSKPLSRDFTLWGKNNPDNFGGHEDCVQVTMTDVFELNDYDCSNELRFVCQVEN